MKYSIRTIFLLAVPLCLFFSANVKAQGTLLLREPTISQDKIVFVYANDLWVTSLTGGDAVRLTSSEGAETLPHFSPDGKWIAFTGQYDGNTDVYIVPIKGGQPQRLTWHPGRDNVTGWTPDGKHVLFISGREGIPTKESKFYKISVSGGNAASLSIPRAAAGELSEDGNYMAYQMISFWDPEWRNHRGGQAKPIWIIDMKNFSLQTTEQTDNERHTNPVWLNGVVYHLSERDYANNIWSYNPKTKETKQHTFHSDFDVKSLDAGNGKIVYEQGAQLHVLDPVSDNTQKLTINVRGDFHWARERWEKVNGNRLTNASLSPSGKRAIFEYRGEILTVPKENGNSRNITNSSGAADRYPIWSPDGKQLAWFSDSSGEYQLMVADQSGLTKPKSYKLPNPTFYFRPDWSPDGKFIAYTDTDYNLWYVELASGKTTKVDTEGYAHPNRSLNPVWSPDSKWITYAKILENQFKVIKAYNVDTKKTHQLTDGMSDSFSPVWDESGKYLYFLASTNFGLNTGWLDMSSFDASTTHAIYMIVLSKDDPSPLLPISDEEGDKEEMKDKDDKKEGNTVKIDIDGIDQRIIALDIPERSYTGLVKAPTDHVFYLEAVPNATGQDLHRYSLKDRKATKLSGGINTATVSGDRKSLLYRKGATWGIVASTTKAIKSEGKLALSNVKVKIDPMPEWQQIFKEGWRYQRDFLYVDNTHGAPWDKIYEWYSPWVKHVRHRSDLNYIVDIIGGEVSIGHSYTSGGDFPDIDNVPIGLLGADLETKNNRLQIKKIYTGENWNPNLQSPLSGPGININEGDYILEVNGKEVNTATNIYQYFEGTTGRQTKIRVNSKPSIDGSRLVTVVPINNERFLRQFNWIEGNRAKVDKLSNGKLAYVYVPNTGGPGFTYFNRYYFAQQDKKGAIIDERNNGGGAAADYMVDVMARDLHGYFNSKVGDHRPFTTPMAGIWGPKVMIINERAGSGGDLLPYLFRKMEIGPLVGTKTWGGLVGTWDTPRFIDNGRMVAPRGGFYDINGEWAVEGVGISPDIEVKQTPNDVIKGSDPQLERAVKEAMKLLETQEVTLKPEPKAPVKWKRPEKK